MVGLIDPKTDKVVPVMISGTDKGISKIKTISSNKDVPQGRDQNTRWEKVVCNDIENDLIRNLERRGTKPGYQSLIALPLKNQAK
jgi:hypothetical protein